MSRLGFAVRDPKPWTLRAGQHGKIESLGNPSRMLSTGLNGIHLLIHPNIKLLLSEAQRHHHRESHTYTTSVSYDAKCTVHSSNHATALAGPHVNSPWVAGSCLAVPQPPAVHATSTQHKVLPTTLHH